MFHLFNLFGKYAININNKNKKWTTLKFWVGEIECGRTTIYETVWHLTGNPRKNAIYISMNEVILRNVYNFIRGSYMI